MSDLASLYAFAGLPIPVVTMGDDALITAADTALKPSVHVEPPPPPPPSLTLEDAIDSFQRNFYKHSRITPAMLSSAQPQTSAVVPASVTTKEKEDENEKKCKPPFVLNLPPCPLCLGVYGRDKGLVPAVITTCIPWAHTICVACVEKHRTLNPNKTLRCPTCNEPCGDIKPLAVENDLTKCDPSTATLLKSITAPRLTEHEAFLSRSSRELAALKERALRDLAGHSAKIVEKRAEAIMKDVYTTDFAALARTGRYSITNYWTEALEFDARDVKLLPSADVSEASIAATLRAIAKSVQPVLDEICTRDKSGLKIKMESDSSVTENGIKAFVYLKKTVDFSKWARETGIVSTATKKKPVRATGQKRRRKRVDPVLSSSSTTVTTGDRKRRTTQRFAPRGDDEDEDEDENDDDDDNHSDEEFSV